MFCTCDNRITVSLMANWPLGSHDRFFKRSLFNKYLLDIFFKLSLINIYKMQFIITLSANWQVIAFLRRMSHVWRVLVLDPDADVQ